MLLVTGATGFIGGHLIESVDGAVRCLVRRSVSLPGGRGSVSSVRGDLATGAGLDEALADVDTVIHLAGATKVLRPGDYYAGNARATENLARRAAGRGIRFVHVSSLAAAGPSLGRAPVAEDDLPHPVSHYGKSKLEAEQIVRALLPDAVIVRPPVVYGPRDTDVLQMLKSVAGGWQLEIGGGERWFSAIYVKDLVEGILAAARAPQAAGRTYFLSHPKPGTWGDLAAVAGRVMNRKPRRLSLPVPAAAAVGWCAEMWARATGKPGIISRDKIAEARYTRWTCDAGRAARELGFEARTSLEEGLARTLAWYKEAGWIKY
jgi:nucleoside-diphosphate-sugar epimerase